MKHIFKVQNGNQIDLHIRVNSNQGIRELTIASDVMNENYADYIIRACNCHEDLVQTAGKILSIAHPSEEFSEPFNNALKASHQALANATKEELL